MIAGLFFGEKELTSAINSVKIFRKIELVIEVIG
jgi:hypothetical protein